MFYSLSGTLSARKSTYIVVDVNGIGFRVAVSEKTLGTSSKLGTKIKLYCHDYVRQNELEIFGFLHERELEIFELLTNISGIGPKIAFKLIDVFDVKGISRAVHSGRADLLMNSSRIGKKTAERIIMELQGKLGHDKTIGTHKNDVVEQEVKDALSNLGYSPREIHAVISRVPHQVKGTKEQLKSALSLLSKR